MEILQHSHGILSADHRAAIVRAAADRFCLSPDEQLELLEELGASSLSQ